MIACLLPFRPAIFNYLEITRTTSTRCSSFRVRLSNSLCKHLFYFPTLQVQRQSQVPLLFTHIALTMCQSLFWPQSAVGFSLIKRDYLSRTFQFLCCEDTHCKPFSMETSAVPQLWVSLLWSVPFVAADVIAQSQFPGSWCLLAMPP